MSLAPIPSRMLHDKAVFYVVTGLDRYQDKVYETYTVEHVIKSTDNEEIQLKGMLFVDCRRSTPALDLYAMQQQSLAAGDKMRVDVYDASDKLVGNFAVMIVDGAPDVPATRTHHWELSLI